MAYIKIRTKHSWRFTVEGAEPVEIGPSEHVQHVPIEIKQDPEFWLAKKDGTILEEGDFDDKEFATPPRPVTHLVRRETVTITRDTHGELHIGKDAIHPGPVAAAKSETGSVLTPNPVEKKTGIDAFGPSEKKPDLAKVMNDKLGK